MASESVTVYKVTGANGEAHIAPGGFAYPLPAGKRAGKWVHCEGALVECGNGLHACRSVLDIGSHMNATGFTVWFAEAKGDCLEGSGKTAFRSLRLVRKSKWCKNSAVLFAADCAERALILSKWEDSRSWNAVSVSRKVALQLFDARSAAYSAYYAARSAAYSARSAAYSAAYSAARSAYYAAYSAYSAAYSAYSAAYSADSAARSAAYSAARSADSANSADSADSADSARQAEMKWQEKRLLQYLEHGIEAMHMECDGWKSTRGLVDNHG